MIVQTVNLTKRYGKLVALDNLDLKIEDGECFGYIGPNGAGKTTTIKILATLLQPTWGEVRVCDHVIGYESRKIRPLMPTLEIVGGVLVIFIGALIFLDRFTIFNQFFTGGVGTVTSAEEGLAGVDVTSYFGFTVAFAAGIVAFLSPCVLPMVPAYLMHLAGVSADAEVGQQRGVTFRHSLAFVVGFSAVFVALGASAGAFGFFVQDHLSLIGKVAGVLLIVMGLNLLGILRIPWLSRTYQLDFANSPGGGETS